MTSLTAEQAFHLAMQRQRAGRFAEAEKLLEEVLARQPANADVIQLLGVLAYQGGRHSEATDRIRRAITIRPGMPAWHSNLGMVLATQRRFPEAIAEFRRAVAMSPEFPEAWNNLGNALGEIGERDPAVSAFREAIRLRPDYVDAHENLGRVLRDAGRIDESLAAYRRAVELNPNRQDARLGIADLLQRKRQLDEAVETCRQILKSRPDFAEAHNSLGHALMDQGRIDDAVASFNRAVALKPNFFEAIFNLGIARQSQGRVGESIPLYRQAIRLRPDFADAHYALGWALLLEGDYDHGWEEFEWRLRRSEWLRSGHRLSMPMWDGSDLAGRRLVLHAEEGFGDTIQFIRYLPKVSGRDGSITLLCPPELQRLFAGLRGIDRLVVAGERLPPFDVQCPLMSLPRIFGTRADSIPAEVPYLFADPELVAQWRERIAPRPDGRNIGIVWAGSAAYGRDQNRSIQLSALAPLAQVAGVRFHSLQLGESAEQTRSLPDGFVVSDWSDPLVDFAETAALIENLDLVIAIDTAVAHLAGAMGKPVWTLVPFAPDWRWGQRRDDSPWYPTMRLFRQTAPFDWPAAIRRVAQALAEWIEK